MISLPELDEKGDGFNSVKKDDLGKLRQTDGLI